MTGRSEARLEVDNREAAAGSSWMSSSVARTGSFVGNILADNKASNKFPDGVAEAEVGRSSRMDLGDMSGNASGALAESSRAGGDAAHICRAVSVLNRHLETRRSEDKERREK